MPEQLSPLDSFRDAYTDFVNGYFQERLNTISRHQYTDRGVWDVAASNAGIKLVVTRGPTGIDAINSENFDGDHYRTAIASREDFSRVQASVSGGLGVLANTGLDKNFAAKLNRTSQLGARLYDTIVNKRSFESEERQDRNRKNIRGFRP